MLHSKSILSYWRITIFIGLIIPLGAVAGVPGDKLDLSNWKITLPVDTDKNGKVDEIDVKHISTFRYPPFFFLDKNGEVVFAAPNKATTTATSTNTRSELRQMIRGDNTRIKTKDRKNNFALMAHRKSKRFGSIGGRMEATLKVLHVAKNAKYPEKYPAYSVVVGQIHAGKDKELIKKGKGFGWGNEPLKIYYKKWPGHDTGSVFWTYERNLEKTNPKRKDIAYPVWGYTWDKPENPGEAGIKLGEEFSYVVNVHENIMYLTFSSPGRSTVNYKINLADNVDAFGKVDPHDHPKGYSGDWHYFKAGAYNQCSVKDDPAFWYPACSGTGDWKTDYENGDFVAVAFSKLTLGESTPVKDSTSTSED